MNARPNVKLFPVYFGNVRIGTIRASSYGTAAKELMIRFSKYPMNRLRMYSPLSRNESA